MTLPRQVFQISLAKGLNQKTDDKQLAPDSLLELENGVFNKFGKISKRNGYDLLSNRVLTSGGSISSGEALHTFQDELLLFNQESLYSYAPANEKWIDKGNVTSLTIDENTVAQNSYDKRNPDVAVANNLKCYVWEDSQGGVSFSVLDLVTKTPIVNCQSISSVGSKPKVVSFNGCFLIIYSYYSFIQCRRVYQSSPTTDEGSFTILSDAHATISNFDVVTVGNKLFVGYYQQTDTAFLSSFDADLYLIRSLEMATGEPIEFLTLSVDSDLNVWMCQKSNTSISLNIYTYSMGSICNLIVISDARVGRAATGVQISDSPIQMQFFYEIESTDGYNHFVQSFKSYLNGSVTDNVVFVRSVGLATKAFSYNDVAYVGLVHESELQSTYFVANSSANIVAKMSPNIAGGLVTNRCLSHAVEMPSGTFTIAGTEKSNISSENGVFYSSLGVVSYELNFTSNAKYITETINNSLLISGGILKSYDGIFATEQNFNLYPENISSIITEPIILVTQQGSGMDAEITKVTCIAANRITSGNYFTINSPSGSYYAWFNVDNADGYESLPGLTGIEVVIASTYTANQVAAALTSAIDATSAFSATTSGSESTITCSTAGSVADADYATFGNGNIDAGTYLYVATYEWIDRASNVHRSSTSLPIEVIVTGSNKSVTIVAPTLRLTDKSDVKIVFYRTTNNGTLFYRVSYESSPILNSTSVDSKYFIDSMSDSDLISNPLLYTTGDVLDNAAPPHCVGIASYRNRLFGISGANKNKIFFSKRVVDNQSLAFPDSELFSISLPETNGNTTGLCVLDDKLIIFKDNAIFYVYGDGPTPSGTQSDYIVPQLISSDVGCVDARSIVIVPSGIMFKSKKGIYLLDRGYQVSYLGAPVENYNSQTITGARALPESNQIIFTTQNNSALVYDHLFQQWSTFTNHEAVGCTIWQNDFCFLTSFGRVYRASESFTDGARHIKLKIVLPWLSLAGIQNYKRIYKIIVLGEYKGSHILKCKQAYDFNPTYIHEASYDVDDVLNVTRYADDYNYADSIPFGGEFPLYQFEIAVKQQKCQSIKVSLEDIQTSDFNEGFDLSSVALEVGLKQGPFKIPASKRFKAA